MAKITTTDTAKRILKGTEEEEAFARRRKTPHYDGLARTRFVVLGVEKSTLHSHIKKPLSKIIDLIKKKSWRTPSRTIGIIIKVKSLR